MSKAAFSSISKSTDPFFCPLCKLSKNELEVKLLKDKVSLLESKLQSALSQLESATWYSRPATHSEASSLSDTAPSPGPQGSQFHGDTASRSDQRCNVVIYGLQECRQGSSRQDRWEEDLKDIVSTLSSVADTIDASSVKDHFRLGKYKLDSRRPRPILVKMIRANDVNKILSEASSLEKPLMIKPGLSRSQQRREALLLKERWKLLEQGVDRKAIKLRGYTSIYINNVKHGSLNNDNRYVLTTPSTSGEAVVHSPENHGVGDHSSQDQEDHLTQNCYYHKHTPATVTGTYVPCNEQYNFCNTCFGDTQKVGKCPNFACDSSTWKRWKCIHCPPKHYTYNNVNYTCGHIWDLCESCFREKSDCIVLKHLGEGYDGGLHTY